MQKAKSLADQLVALRSPVSEDDFITYITEGLGSNFRPFVHALKARHETITFDYLYGLLLSEEIQLQRDDPP